MRALGDEVACSRHSAPCQALEASIFGAFRLPAGQVAVNATWKAISPPILILRRHLRDAMRQKASFPL